MTRDQFHQVDLERVVVRADRSVSAGIDRCVDRNTLTDIVCNGDLSCLSHFDVETHYLVTVVSTM